jgi:hypothetical protein
MKKVAILLGCTLALGACSTEEDRLENAMRETLSARGEVKQIEMTKQDQDRMTGFAVVHPAGGREGRLNCNANRTSGTSFNWRCVPAIDEAMLTDIENSIRENLARQGTVEEVEMTRRDDDNMAGFARLRDSYGAEGRFNCTAARDAGDQGNFTWRCLPPGEGAGGAGGAGGGDE